MGNAVTTLITSARAKVYKVYFQGIILCRALLDCSARAFSLALNKLEFRLGTSG